MSLFSCLVKDTKCWEHGESDWVPDRGKQLLHFPGSFVSAGVRYLSKVGVSPPVAAGCPPSPRNGQSSSKAALCRNEQREQGISVGSLCIPLAHQEFCSGILKASKPSRLPRGVWEEISSAGEDTKKEAVSGYGFSGSEVQLDRAQGCDLPAWLGCLAAELNMDPPTRQRGSVSPGLRHLFRRC